MKGLRSVPVTVTLLGVLLAVYALAHGSARLLAAREPGAGFSYAVLLYAGAKINSKVSDGDLWRLVTCQYFHAGLLHLVANAWGLFNLGAYTEILLGPHRMIVLWFFSGLAGSLAGYLFIDSPSVGASGAIFGLFGALLLSTWKYANYAPPGAMKRLRAALMPWLVINLALGLSDPRIDNAAHIGGLVSGAAIAALLGARIREIGRAAPALRSLAWLCVALVVAAFALLLREAAVCMTSGASFLGCYADELRPGP